MTAPAVVRRWARPGPPAGVMAGLVVRDLKAVFRRAVPPAAVLLTAVAANAGLAPHLAVGGAAPDVALVAVVAVAAGGGPRAGAAFGFAAGIGTDLFLATPLGTSALAYTLVGHLVGRSSRPRPPVSAAALCSPTSTCFACRTGRRPATAPNDAQPSVGGRASRSARQRRQALIRRANLRRSAVLTGAAVAAGRLGTAGVATALGGIPFATSAGLLRILGVAVLSAPLGVPALALGRRFGRGGELRR